MYYDPINTGSLPTHNPDCLGPNSHSLLSFPGGAPIQPGRSFPLPFDTNTIFVNDTDTGKLYRLHSDLSLEEIAAIPLERLQKPIFVVRTGYVTEALRSILRNDSPTERRLSEEQANFFYSIGWLSGADLTSKSNAL